MKRFLWLPLLVVMISMAAISVSAEREYPFPDCTELIGERDYVIYQAANNGSVFMIVYDNDVSLCVKKPSSSFSWILYFDNELISYHQNYPTIPNTKFSLFCLMNNIWTELLSSGPVYFTLEPSLPTMLASSKIVYMMNSQGIISTLFQQAPLTLEEPTTQPPSQPATTVEEQPNQPQGAIVRTADFSAVLRTLSENLPILLAVGVGLLLIFLTPTLIRTVIGFFLR